MSQSGMLTFVVAAQKCWTAECSWTVAEFLLLGVQLRCSVACLRNCWGYGTSDTVVVRETRVSFLLVPLPSEE